MLVKGPIPSLGYYKVPQGARARREWLEGNDLWGSELELLFGFKHVEVYSSAFLGNALVVEALLQKRFQSLPLGYWRLWRKYIDTPARHVNPSKVGFFRVFITWSTTVGQMSKANHLKVKK